MILSGPEILRLWQRTQDIKKVKELRPELPLTGVPSLDITPFDPEQVGPNSYDVRLSSEYACYDFGRDADGNPTLECLDARSDNATKRSFVPAEGMVFYPGRLYLCSTVERTECHGLVPWLDGRSSVGRLGVHVHATAGRGDDGFAGHWTLELSVIHPVRLYPKMKIGQVTFFRLHGVRKPYTGRYQNQPNLPVASRLWQPDPPPAVPTPNEETL